MDEGEVSSAAAESREEKEQLTKRLASLGSADSSTKPKARVAIRSSSRPAGKNCFMSQFLTSEMRVQKASSPSPTCERMRPPTKPIAGE